MSISASCGFASIGITVPYPPTFEGVRTNAGFVDLRGRPDLVAQIHEATASVALAAFLRTMAEDDEWISLGCDIGDHSENDTRFFAGGYIHFASSDFFISYEFYERLSDFISRELAAAADEEKWHISLKIGDVAFNLSDECWHIGSLYVWFDAEDSTRFAAEQSRERLIDCLHHAVLGKK